MRRDVHLPLRKLLLIRRTCVTGRDRRQEHAASSGNEHNCKKNEVKMLVSFLGCKHEEWVTERTGLEVKLERDIMSRL